jgi:hypothetical protein
VWPVAHIVRPAIDLDRNPPFEASKIQHQLTERMMAPKLEASRPIAQFTPDQGFRQIP